MASTGFMTAKRAPGAGKTRVQAEHHFRESEAGIVGGDAIAAAQRQFEPAAEAEAVDQGDGGRGKAGELVEDGKA